MAFIPSSGSVIAFQSNPSSLLTGASIIGLTPVSVSNFPTVSGSVLSFMGGAWSVSIIGSLTPPANQSVSGSVGIVGTPSISGTVLLGNAPSIYGNISGSVVSFQGGSWSTSISGTPAVSVQGTVFVSGSVITVGGVAAANQSVSGTVGASVIGNVNTTITSVATAGGFLNVNLVGGSILTSSTANQSVSGSVGITGNVTVVSSIAGGIFPISGSVSAFVTNIQGASISGTVNVTGSPSISGTINIQSIIGVVGVSIIGTLSATVAQGSSISGTVLAQGINAPNSSVTGNAVYVGGLDQNGSIQGAKIVTVVSVAGGLAWLGVASVSGNVGQTGTTITSIAGGYAIATGSIISGLGVLALGVRNDTMASVFGADGAYSPLSVGPTGENIIANSPINKWVSGSTSIVSGASVAAIAAQGTGIFTYVTGVQVVNNSGNNVYVTFSGATTSVLGYTVAPANGGSNVVYPNPLRVVANGAFSASISGVASIFVSAQGFVSKT